MANSKKPSTTKNPRKANAQAIKKAQPIDKTPVEDVVASASNLWRWRLSALVSGVSIVSLWTLLRSITNGVNFDVVGQIGLAEQWSHGLHGGAQLGSTNYLLKIPVYLFVNKLDFLSPHHRLLAIALLFNIATFGILFVLLEKTSRLYHLRPSRLLYVALIWLATIAGGVFWMDYANSRNLETIGGLVFLYLTLKLAKQWRWSTVLGLMLVAIVAFFADPLQAYICGSSVIIFGLIRLAGRRNRQSLRYSLAIIVATAIGWLGAKDLQQLAIDRLHISFLVAPANYAAVSFHKLPAILKALVLSSLDVFDANFLKRPYSPNTLRQLINAFVIILLIALVVRVIYKKRLRLSRVPWLLIIVIALNYVVYIASGQVLAPHTARYLVIVPLVSVMLLATIGDRLATVAWRRKLGSLWLLLIAASVILLVGALAIKWPSRYSKDDHIDNLISFMQQHNYKYALGSRETGITTTYFSNGATTILPMGCSGHQLQPTDLFYDNQAFNLLGNYHADIPILLQDNQIQFGSESCQKADIVKQFGEPIQEIAVPGYGTALLYDAKSISFAHSIVQPGKPTTPLSTVATNTDTNLTKLSGCEVGTVDVIVAHPDDDLLFMNPPLAKLVGSACVRTTFVTAADDGRPADYWLGRQHGIEAAYAAMAKVENDWSDKTELIYGHQVLVRSLNPKPSISLIFMRLPDGNVHGQGFATTGALSLEKISTNQLSLETVDKTSIYNFQDVTNTISDILKIDQPNLILTHVTGGEHSRGDHSDHRMVGQLTAKARQQAHSSATIKFFVGYPSNGLAENLKPADADYKRMIFDTYANFDTTICNSGQGCHVESTFGKYLKRCYVQANYGTNLAPCLDKLINILPVTAGD